MPDEHLEQLDDETFYEILQSEFEIEVEFLNKALDKFFLKPLPNLTYSYRVVDSESGNKTVDSSLSNLTDLITAADAFSSELKETFINAYEYYSEVFEMLDELNTIALSIDTSHSKNKPTHEYIIKFITFINNLESPRFDDIRTKLFILIPEFLSGYTFSITRFKVEWKDYLLNYFETNIDRLFQSKPKVKYKELEQIEVQLFEVSVILTFEESIKLFAKLRAIVHSRRNYIANKLHANGELTIEQNERYIVEGSNLKYISYDLSKKLDDLNNQLDIRNIQESIQLLIEILLADIPNQSSYEQVQELFKQIEVLVKLDGTKWILDHSEEIIPYILTLKDYLEASNTKPNKAPLKNKLSYLDRKITFLKSLASGEG